MAVNINHFLLLIICFAIGSAWAGGENVIRIPVGAKAKIICADLNLRISIVSVKPYSSQTDLETLDPATSDQCGMLEDIKTSCDTHRTCQAQRPPPSDRESESESESDADSGCQKRPIILHYRCTALDGNEQFLRGRKRNHSPKRIP
ncbi:hypothetical protein BV898_09086 [Hypsibius exemplaris]|uniref:SUEL-type lectin domain-containing protein n=1 Tax=Hypsibius exemplaris TaxID=2072580 RepID=A0A1W0WNE7_HYPEX|nr:hypothetical protein BV898_09086 [Hypsibius exemplaris]